MKKSLKYSILGEKALNASCSFPVCYRGLRQCRESMLRGHGGALEARNGNEIISQKSVPRSSMRMTGICSCH